MVEVFHFIVSKISCFMGRAREMISTLYWMWKTLVEAQLGGVGGDTSESNKILVFTLFIFLNVYF